MEVWEYILILTKKGYESFVGWLSPLVLGLKTDTRDFKALWHTFAVRTILGYQGV